MDTYVGIQYCEDRMDTAELIGEGSPFFFFERTGHSFEKDEELSHDIYHVTMIMNLPTYVRTPSYSNNTVWTHLDISQPPSD